MKANKLNQFVHDEIIHSLIVALNEHYIFPDIAKEIEKDLELKLAKKTYENIKCPETFSKQVTDDLQKISKDKHLRLRYTEQEKPIHHGLSMKEQMEAHLLEAKVNSYGFHKIERLLGNIGYIDLRIFFDPMFAGEAAVNAMNLVSTTDALIFDLRKNEGGSPFMVAFIISYLFDSEPFHLNTFHSRSDEFGIQTWTSSY